MSDCWATCSIIQWKTSCYKNDMTTYSITFWDYILLRHDNVCDNNIMFHKNIVLFEGDEVLLKLFYDKQSLTPMVISYASGLFNEMITCVRSSI